VCLYRAGGRSSRSAAASLSNHGTDAASAAAAGFSCWQRRPSQGVHAAAVQLTDGNVFGTQCARDVHRSGRVHAWHTWEVSPFRYLSVNSPAPEFTARVKPKDRVEVRVRVRVRVRVSVSVSLNKNNSDAGELTDKYPKWTSRAIPLVIGWRVPLDGACVSACSLVSSSKTKPCKFLNWQTSWKLLANSEMDTINRTTSCSDQLMAAYLRGCISLYFAALARIFLLLISLMLMFCIHSYFV